MSLCCKRSRVADIAPEGCEGFSPPVALSERWARLSDAKGDIAWPDSVIRAMTALKIGSDRVAGLADRISVSASSLGDPAATAENEERWS